MVRESDLLWTPGAGRIADANITTFMRWLEDWRGLSFANYDALWRWSVGETEAFWGALWDYFDIKSSAPYQRVLASSAMPGATWFPGAKLNYAEHVLRRERPGADALLFVSEDAAPVGVRWEDFSGRVRILATALRALGVRPGDRVAAYAPNIPDNDRHARDRRDRRHLGELLARFRFARRARPARSARADLLCVGGYRYGARCSTAARSCGASSRA